MWQRNLKQKQFRGMKGDVQAVVIPDVVLSRSFVSLRTLLCPLVLREEPTFYRVSSLSEVIREVANSNWWGCEVIEDG